jgi:hypothetical protein
MHVYSVPYQNMISKYNQNINLNMLNLVHNFTCMSILLHTRI